MRSKKLGLMRTASRHTIIAVLAAVLLVAGSGFSARAADPVRFGAQIGANYSLRLVLQEIQGKYDLKYDFRDFNSGNENILALEQREVDVSIATGQQLLRAVSDGIPAVWVAGWGGGYNVFVAKSDLPVKAGDYEGLKVLAKERAAAGKKLKIGVPSGSMQHLLLLSALKDAGIDSDRDVDIVNVPFPVLPRAIENGEIQMAAGLALFSAMSITQGNGKLFDHMFGGKWGKQEIGFFLNKKTIDEKPDFAQRIVGSLVEAVGRLENADQRFALEAKGSKLPPDVIAMTEKQFLFVDYRTRTADFTEMARRMFAAGWTKSDLSSEMDKNVDFHFVEKATGKSKADLSNW